MAEVHKINTHKYKYLPKKNTPLQVELPLQIFNRSWSAKYMRWDVVEVQKHQYCTKKQCIYTVPIFNTIYNINVQVEFRFAPHERSKLKNVQNNQQLFHFFITEIYHLISNSKNGSF